MRRSVPARRLLQGVRVLLVLLVASVFLGGGPVRAQSEGEPAAGTLGGFSGSAAASAIRATYYPEGLLPTGALVELGVPDALATIANGPSTFARASAADPGDVIANPDALLAQATSAWKAGTLPPYPYRISAASGVGAPTAESRPAPGITARVAVRDNGSTAESVMPGLSTPGVVTAGSLTAGAETSTDGNTVSVHARSKVGEIDILGLIHIDGLITDVTATSVGGAPPELKGGTTVTGASLLGQPIVIDDKGIRAAAGGLDLAGLLKGIGVTITLPGRVAMPGSTAGQLAATGLRIDIAATSSLVPGLDDLFDALPPIEPLVPGLPGVEDIIAVARANHLVTVEVGRGVVALSASPEVVIPDLPPIDAGPPTISSTDTGVIPSAPLPALEPVTNPMAPPAAAVPDPIVTTQPTGLSVGAGVGALAALVLLLQPFLGDRLARAAAIQLGTDEEGCPWERR